LRGVAPPILRGNLWGLPGCTLALVDSVAVFVHGKHSTHCITAAADTLLVVTEVCAGVMVEIDRVEVRKWHHLTIRGLTCIRKSRRRGEQVFDVRVDATEFSPPFKRVVETVKLSLHRKANLTVSGETAHFRYVGVPDVLGEGFSTGR
jgi:hypothetical protein